MHHPPAPSLNKSKGGGENARTFRIVSGKGAASSSTTVRVRRTLVLSSDGLKSVVAGYDITLSVLYRLAL